MNSHDSPISLSLSICRIKDKEAKIIVYCSDGRRAMRARKILLEKGYTHVLNAGGILTDVHKDKKAYVPT
jgi:rhodanese-related sulfurtransferase